MNHTVAPKRSAANLLVPDTVAHTQRSQSCPSGIIGTQNIGGFNVNGLNVMADHCIQNFILRNPFTET